MASSSISGLTAVTTIGTGDLFTIVVAPAGADTNNKITYANVLAQIQSSAFTFTHKSVPFASASTGLLVDDGSSFSYDTSTNILSVDTVSLATGLVVQDPGVGANSILIQAPTLSGDYTLTLPVDDGTSGQLLQTDGSGVLSWVTNNNGNVTGPGSATDNAVCRFDSTTGQLIQNSVVIIGDTGAITGAISLGIGAAASASAAIKLTSTTQGIGLPGMTTTQRNNISSPDAGLLVFDSTLNQFFGYNGSAWVILG